LPSSPRADGLTLSLCCTLLLQAHKPLAKKFFADKGKVNKYLDARAAAVLPTPGAPVRLGQLLQQHGVVVMRVSDKPQAADSALIQDAHRALRRVFGGGEAAENGGAAVAVGGEGAAAGVRGQQRGGEGAAEGAGDEAASASRGAGPSGDKGAAVRGAGGGAAARTRLMAVVSDDSDFQPLLRSATAAGWRTAAVCVDWDEYPSADVTLDWGLVMQGAYGQP
jgi:hypothetical protein